MAYPDAVALLVAYLDALHAVPVLSRVPDPRPAEFIQIRHIGGTDVRPVRDDNRLDVFYWAATDPAAFTGAELVRREIHALAGTTTLGGVMCYRVDEFLSPRQFDDPETGLPRRWATYSLVLRADDAIAH